MIARYVDPVKTPLTFEQASRVMRSALKASLGDALTDRILTLVLAKSALETGRWKSCWNHNFGNQKAGPKYSGMFTAISLNEVLGGKVVWFSPQGEHEGGLDSPIVGQRWGAPPWHPQTRMRAHVGPTDGAYSYVEFIEARPTIWNGLLTGDPTAFVDGMVKARYFTASPEKYLNGVRLLQREYLSKIRGVSFEHAEPEPDWDALRLLVAAQQVDVAGPLVTEGLRDLAGLPANTDQEDPGAA